ncbi:nucleic acid-binding protein [Aulographum hederae CBS 113979]|uniref:Nucleic acid-binding protein n=1 Tax=Aulographum hederae CBS 113979 TaxID=1176131 RepID=A0A6G1GW79_9PEZI|nr:nucleic acid-binding protein [Aulographum hederae CBS 113979]
MSFSKRKIQATAEETLTPPDSLSEGQFIAQVVKISSHNLYDVKLPSGDQLLVELPARFRKTIWIKLRGYVLIDTANMLERDNKLHGEIINVVRNEKLWRKEKYWPAEFQRSPAYDQDSEEDESNVGKMPPSDDENET